MFLKRKIVNLCIGCLAVLTISCGSNHKVVNTPLDNSDYYLNQNVQDVKNLIVSAVDLANKDELREAIYALDSAEQLVPAGSVQIKIALFTSLAILTLKAGDRKAFLSYADRLEKSVSQSNFYLQEETQFVLAIRKLMLNQKVNSDYPYVKYKVRVIVEELFGRENK